MVLFLLNNTIMNNFKKSSIFFLIGGIGYGLIEILWRGHTHWSMLSLGGICFTVFGKISSNFKKVGLLYKSIIGCIFVTAAELIYGIIFNIILKKNVWDYSNVPLNFKGQICLLYSVFWWILGLIFIPLADFLNNRLKKL